jgi:hypothetical protein
MVKVLLRAAGLVLKCLEKCARRVASWWLDLLELMMLRMMEDEILLWIGNGIDGVSVGGALDEGGME